MNIQNKSKRHYYNYSIITIGTIAVGLLIFSSFSSRGLFDSHDSTPIQVLPISESKCSDCVQSVETVSPASSSAERPVASCEGCRAISVTPETTPSEQAHGGTNINVAGASAVQPAPSQAEHGGIQSESNIVRPVVTDAATSGNVGSTQGLEDMDNTESTATTKSTPTPFSGNGDNTEPAPTSTAQDMSNSEPTPTTESTPTPFSGNVNNTEPAPTSTAQGMNNSEPTPTTEPTPTPTAQDSGNENKPPSVTEVPNTNGDDSCSLTATCTPGPGGTEPRPDVDPSCLSGTCPPGPGKEDLIKIDPIEEMGDPSINLCPGEGCMPGLEQGRSSLNAINNQHGLPADSERNIVVEGEAPPAQSIVPINPDQIVPALSINESILSTELVANEFAIPEAGVQELVIEPIEEQFPN